jgi:hypothetical protein
MKLNGAHQLLVSADIVNLLTDGKTDASKELHLEVNAEKTEYMLLSHHQNDGQNPD